MTMILGCLQRDNISSTKPTRIACFACRPEAKSWHTHDTSKRPNESFQHRYTRHSGLKLDSMYCCDGEMLRKTHNRTAGGSAPLLLHLGFNKPFDIGPEDHRWEWMCYRPKLVSVGVYLQPNFKSAFQIRLAGRTHKQTLLQCRCTWESLCETDAMRCSAAYKCRGLPHRESCSRHHSYLDWMQIRHVSLGSCQQGRELACGAEGPCACTICIEVDSSKHLKKLDLSMLCRLCRLSRQNTYI